MMEVKPLYGPGDVEIDYERDLGDPGQFPFTRGVYPDMYRGRPWTRRVQVGFGTPQETNQRLKYLFDEGQGGFILTIDLPTSYGFDSDDELAEGEVGVTGVAISTVEDMEAIFDGFDPDTVSASLSIRPPVSAVSLAMLALVAERRGIALDRVARHAAERPAVPDERRAAPDDRAVLPVGGDAAAVPGHRRVHVARDAAAELDGHQRLQPA